MQHKTAAKHIHKKLIPLFYIKNTNSTNVNFIHILNFYFFFGGGAKEKKRKRKRN